MLRACGDPRLVRRDPVVDVGEHLLGAAARPPLVQAEELRAVGKVYRARRPARVSATGSIGTSLPVRRAADLGRLQQREAALAAAADVDGAPVPGVGIEQLALDQVDQVLDVEQVAHLLALAAEADVAERVAEVVGEHPVREDALVDLAHLPRPGDDAAAVDHRGHAEAGPVLLDQQLGGELGGAVEGAGAVEREVLGDARRRDPGDRLLGGDLEAGLAPPPALSSTCGRDRVDAAGREEDDEGAVAAGQLEAVVGAGQVGVDEVAGVAVDAAHHRGLGRALDQGRDPRQPRQVGGLAHVAARRTRPRPPRSRGRFSSEPRR